MESQLHFISIYGTFLVFFSAGIYLLFKSKKEYREYQKKTKSTSILCFSYHELYVGFACYTAWFNVWPFFDLNNYITFHLSFLFIGFFPALTGIIIYFWYLSSIKSFLRALGRNSDKLITDGIYKLSRNPQSLSKVVGFIGISIMGRSFFTLLLGITWITINHFYILNEEEYLESQFGESYQKYCTSTPRYCTLKKNNNTK
jgi:protein-S-isoprenylcysteine O-methyltransferase Ste14